MPRLLLVVLVLLACPAAVRAQAISFDEALALGEDAPDVRGAERALASRARRDRDISDVTSATELQLVPGVRVLREQDRGFEGSIGVVQGWSLAGLGGARRRAAEDERAVIAAERRAIALERRIGAARAWIELSVLERQLALAIAERDIARELEERARRAADVGVITAPDASEVSAFHGETQLAAHAAEGARLAGALALADAMAVRAEETMHTTGGAPSPELPGHDELEARLSDVEGLPRVEMARLAAIAARAREAERAALAGPTMQTGLQVYREAPDGLMIFGQLSFGIPLVDLGARDRSLALEEAERADAALEAHELEARRRAVEIAHEVDHTRRAEQTLREVVVPALEALVSSREAQMRAGETTTMLLLDARRRSLAARSRLVQVEGARRWAEVRAWLMLASRARAERVEER
ncbi:hypothetical protein [Sandaracinus amylolyticus]|uniref:Heavy metal RND efflux outer membrane protein, CzcC family n=1 Tax=Sandaracinus amylolyticus TaxID=927083 RepID=A0A0F6YJU5_9BACT|nr:hypothetical protein [Sandaracinus amylolyticus]AKF08501.1 Heavy metal RND efflux outer membrane protein, CzcC family [Sandaracinus amylolyticus]